MGQWVKGWQVLTQGYKGSKGGNSSTNTQYSVFLTCRFKTRRWLRLAIINTAWWTIQLHIRTFWWRLGSCGRDVACHGKGVHIWKWKNLCLLCNAVKNDNICRIKQFNWFSWIRIMLNKQTGGAKTSLHMYPHFTRKNVVEQSHTRVFIQSCPLIGCIQVSLVIHQYSLLTSQNKFQI